MDMFKTILTALVGFGLLLWAMVAEVKAAEPLTAIFTVVSTVKIGMDLHDRFTKPPAALPAAPAAPAPTVAPPPAVTRSRPLQELAMVVLPPRPYYRNVFERSMVAADYPREKGVPEPLPLGQWKELMVDLAMLYRCSGPRPTTCEIPGDTRSSFKVFFDVTYEAAT